MPRNRCMFRWIFVTLIVLVIDHGVVVFSPVYSPHGEYWLHDVFIDRSQEEKNLECALMCYHREIMVYPVPWRSVLQPLCLSDISTRTFQSVDNGSQKCFFLVTNVPQSRPTVRSPQNHSLDPMKIISLGHTVGQPNFERYSPKDVSYLDSGMSGDYFRKTKYVRNKDPLNKIKHIRSWLSIVIKFNSNSSALQPALSI
jgi:hypothetical protein